MNQAEDRAHRISQQNCVTVYYLYGPNTLDEIMFRMIDNKTEVVTDAVDGKAHDYQLSRTSKTDAFQEINELKEEGKLNPVIVNRKKVGYTPKINEIFRVSNDFVKRDTSEEPQENP